MQLTARLYWAFRSRGMLEKVALKRAIEKWPARGGEPPAMLHLKKFANQQSLRKRLIESLSGLSILVYKDGRTVRSTQNDGAARLLKSISSKAHRGK
jgi:hypothetical protein